MSMLPPDGAVSCVSSVCLMTADSLACTDKDGYRRTRDGPQDLVVLYGQGQKMDDILEFPRWNSAQRSKQGISCNK
jgi:hypothetical protein